MADQSRRDRFVAIMDAASGDASPDYDGHPRFWRRPVAELRTLSLYGVPLFDAAGAFVRGLRGEYPFDGTQFPRLPWGGSALADADIAYIERWIADGMPDDDAPASTAPQTARLEALSNGAAPHELFTEPVNALAETEPGRLRQRKNINYLTAEELQRFRDAVARMKSFDAYDQDERSFGYWARIHASLCQHGWEEFLTWHRAYLYFFEQQLEDVDTTVTLPYWDWTADAADVAASITDMGDATYDNGVIPAAYRCWIDEAAVERLRAGGHVAPDVLAKLAAMIGKPPENSGARFFASAGITYGADPAGDAAIKNELAAVNPLFHWNRWPGGSKSIIFEAYPTPDDVTQILKIPSFFAFGSGPMNDQYFGALENIHNLIHNFSGGINPFWTASSSEPQTGDMVNAGVTAYDPIFWGHHANVDRVWSEWQGLNPNAGPDDPDIVLAPWSMRVADTSSIAKLGYEYMMDSRLFATDADNPLVRFRSQSVAIHPNVVRNHRRAEIRIHAVQQVTRAGFHVRAFLNAPDANAETPARGNDHYAGQVNMFTGLCIGGPGHCAVPGLRTRRYDRRQQHHKLPSNFRIDATDTVRRLADAGATDFQVNLVVLNTDGTPATDALFANGVSLNFID